jgi:flagellar L-ring protein precursor FlgH
MDKNKDQHAAAKKQTYSAFRMGGGKRGFLKILTAQALIFALCGCGHMLDSLDLRDETVLPPAYPIDNPAPPKTQGTIYQAGHEVSLFQDHIASRVGDILTIRLEVATNAEKQAKTKATKTTIENTDNGTASPPVLLGSGFSKLIFNNGTDLQFDGKGETNQYNKLQGTISVTVVRVLANTNMVIQGETWITINQGREYVRITGIVRPEDIIDTSNVVSSQRVADARISYSGSGQVANASRGGLLTQFMYKFFPF